MSAIFAPFVWVLTKTTNGLLRLFGINPHEEEEAASEEELRIMLDTSSEAGTIDSMENEMIQNIFEFDDILISEVCTHRRDVKMLYRDDDFDDWKKTISQSRHGYYPICGENSDDIVGVLNIKKFFRAEICSKARLGNHVICNFECCLGSYNRVTPVCNICKRSAVDKCRCPLKRLNEIWLESVL